MRLTFVPGIGGERQRQLLAAFGPPEQIFGASRNAIAGVIGAKLADALLTAPDEDRIDGALAWADEAGNTIIPLGDPAYPATLLEIPDPPVLLYVKGQLELLRAPSVAMVGARSSTPQGDATASAFGKALSESGLCIVSGLASGIDAAAHRGALEGSGATIAVIGTGADRVYPARNRSLAQRIAAAGTIVSEFPLGTPALAHNFPRRNRLIAGLALGVLVVEAAVDSGSLITARLAADQGREVFAIPGSIHSPLAKGCHRLIRQGAKLVETAADVLEELHWRARTTPPLVAPSPLADEAAQAQGDTGKVLRALGHDPLDMDTLAGRTGLTPEALYAILLAMELDGRLARLPGNRVQRLS